MCFESSISPNLGPTLRSFGASSSSHCLGHRELVYKLFTPANPLLIHIHMWIGSNAHSIQLQNHVCSADATKSTLEC